MTMKPPGGIVDHQAAAVHAAALEALRRVNAPVGAVALAEQGRLREAGALLKRRGADLDALERAFRRATRDAYPGASRRGAYYQRWLRLVREAGVLLELPGYTTRVEEGPLFGIEGAS